MKHLKVWVTVEPKDGYFRARAQAAEVTDDYSVPLNKLSAGAQTKWCESRSEQRAASYALAEMAVMLDKGLVPLKLVSQ